MYSIRVSKSLYTIVIMASNSSVNQQSRRSERNHTHHLSYPVPFWHYFHVDSCIRNGESFESIGVICSKANNSFRRLVYHSFPSYLLFVTPHSSIDLAASSRLSHTLMATAPHLERHARPLAKQIEEKSLNYIKKKKTKKKKKKRERLRRQR